MSNKEKIPYSSYLQSPQWQKMRLQILERDNFSCRSCANCEQTLHVHHCYYERGKKPWEYPESSLVTLCKDCHEIETGDFYTMKNFLSNKIASHGAMTTEFVRLGYAFEKGSIPHTPEVFFTALAEFISGILTDEDTGRAFMAEFFESIPKGAKHG